MSALSPNKIREMQEVRQSYFPPDRIPFYNSKNAVTGDIEVFYFYEKHGDSVAGWCSNQIAENNYLEKGSVTREVFINTAKSLGYFPRKQNVRVE